MKAFLDSSSVIKLYYPEADSESLEKYIDENVDEIFLSELTILEFRSAMWRKVRTQEVTEKIALKSIHFFENDYADLSWIQLNQKLIESAQELLMKYGSKGLRTLDALQLASALTLKFQDSVFLTADELLKALLIEEGLKVVG